MEHDIVDDGCRVLKDSGGCVCFACNGIELKCDRDNDVVGDGRQL